MLLNEFDYNLPEELIAQTPCAKRDHSRLMVLNINIFMILNSIYAKVIL